MSTSDHHQTMGVSGIEPGTELNQTYRVDALIGVGGMGEVFRGHNLQTGDPVAIKIVLPEYAHDDVIIELFRKEARVLNHLAHDAIVRYYVFTIDRTLGRPYLAMEFVDGPSLAEHLRSGPVSGDDVDLLRRRLADGLHRANEAGVVHRDISPDNVILPGGSVTSAKIIDFGIARTAGVGGGTLLGGSFAGKYNYVSPEQLGLFGGDVTRQSDIYSLGLVLAAALRGRPIDMNGTQVEVVEKRRAVPPLDDIPDRFRPLLAAMLQPDPARRLKTMAEVRDFRLADLNDAASDNATVIRPQQGATPSAAQGSQPRSSTSGAKPLTGDSAEGEATQPPFRLGLFAAALGVAVMLGVGGGWLFVKGNAPGGIPAAVSEESTVPGSGTSEATTTETPSTDAPPAGGQAQTPAAPETTAQNPPPPKAQPQTPRTPPPEVPPAGTATVQKPAAVASGTTAAEGARQLADGGALRRFVASYSAGGCFHAGAPADDSGTNVIPAYAGSQPALDDFAVTLAASGAKGAVVDGHVVAPPQCAVLETLAALSSPGATPVRLEMTNEGGPQARAANGKYVLEARLHDAGPRNVSVLLVSDDGGVQNINRICARCLSMENDVMKVRLPLQQPPEAGNGSAGNLPFRPVLLVALASPRNLLSISAQNFYAASSVLPSLKAEVAASRDVAAAVGYFKLPRGGS